LILSALRQTLRLPKARCSSEIESEWVAMRDGVRLATRHVWPIGVEDTPPTLLIRTPYGTAQRLAPTLIAARLFAESGYHVVLQDVRGRYESEGRFEPFVSEREDGGDTLRWLTEQPWCDGRIGLFGASYSGYTAWAALEDAPEVPGAIAVAIGSGDIYHSFYFGGAFALAVAFEWGIGIGEQRSISRRSLDLARGLAHRPTREADRVAHRVVSWYRDWLDHPREDDYWRSIQTKLPATVPPALLVGGWHDPFLAAQLGDYARLREHADLSGSAPPQLIVGPWAHGRVANRRWWRQGFVGTMLRASLQHFERQLATERDAAASPHDGPREPVRYFVSGLDRWRYQSCWPPADVEPRRLYLHAEQGGAKPGVPGTLDFSPPSRTADEAADDSGTGAASEYDHDPTDPAPSVGGAMLGVRGGAKDQRGTWARSDIVAFESAALGANLEVAGPVTLALHASTNAEDVDFSARLIDVAPDGRALNVCDGIVRRRWQRAAADDLSRADGQDEASRADGQEEAWFPAPDEVREVTIELGEVATTFLMGHRIRLEIASASFPRFDRNPGTRALPATAAARDARCSRQKIVHDAQHLSSLLLPVR
jgi:putative CocE/NonD family hydrolase